MLHKVRYIVQTGVSGLAHRSIAFASEECVHGNRD